MVSTKLSREMVPVNLSVVSVGDGGTMIQVIADNYCYWVIAMMGKVGGGYLDRKMFLYRDLSKLYPNEKRNITEFFSDTIMFLNENISRTM